MEEQKTDQPTIELILQNLNIRTMKRDLEMVAEKEKKEAPLPLAKVPPPPIPKAKVAEKPAPKAEKPVSLVEQLLKQAKESHQQKRYQEVINLSQQIIKDKTSSWFLRFQAERLIKKSKNAQEKLNQERQARLKAELAKQVTPPITTAQPIPEAITYKALGVELPVPRTLPPEITPPLPTAAKEGAFAPAKKLKISIQPVVSSLFSSLKALLKPATIKKIGPLLKPLITSSIVLGAAMVVLVIILAYYWHAPSPPPPEPTPTPPQPEVPVPSPVFLMETKEIIELNEQQLPELLNKIQLLTKNNQPGGNFTHLVVKQINGQIKYLDLPQVLSALNISLPNLKCPDPNNCPENSKLVDNLFTDQYSLFLYYQKEQSQLFFSTTTPSAILPSTTTPALLSTSTPAARLGLVIKLKDSTKAKQILADGEPQLPQFFQPMLLAEKPMATTTPFKDNLYRDVLIRYVNFPEKFLSLDYAIWQDWLLITTSKECTYAVLDRILTPQ